MGDPFLSLDAGTAKKTPGLTAALVADRQPATLLVRHDLSKAERLATRTLTLKGTRRAPS